MNTTAFEILLVEDNIDEAILAKRALKKCNIANSLIHLNNGGDALDYIFRRGQFKSRIMMHPKLVLLDLKMYGLSGKEILSQIKGNESTKHIPVVILTSSTEDPDIEDCFRLGANGYLCKPVVFDKFVDTVVKLGFYWLLVGNNTSEPQTATVSYEVTRN